MAGINQNETPIFTALKEYHKRNVVAFDVPGHKHGVGLKEFTDFVGPNVMEVDVNAMKCLDNICNPIGVIRQAEELAAYAFGSDNAFFLVNGTTAGVQAMIMSACKPGEKIILPRNAHKSAVSGIILSGAIPIYIQPEINEDLGIAMGISIESLEKTIGRHPDAKAVFVINPTYYGMTTNLKEVVSIAHRNGMAVLVDEAHGAHMAFHRDFPLSAMEAGADMSAVSTHKTGGSLTQSSLLLLRQGIIDPFTVKKSLNLTQTTSASYLLMSSVDVARKQLATRGFQLLNDVLKLARDARKAINQIPGLYAFGEELIGSPGIYDFDETKLSVNVAKIGLTGFEVYDLLVDQYNIQVEMADYYNIMAIISVGDTEEPINALVQALKHIAENHRRPEEVKLKNSVLKNPDVIVSPRDAYYSNKKTVKLEEAVGEVSGESIMAYPPGIPLVAPGEKITQEIIDYILLLKEEESLLQGTEDPYIEYVRVLGFGSKY
ncbi:aminotransferase class I/II-fold pyridoxal phosphate-dependent enzyme [Serpentinicella alkaliphila]|uniref:Arginine decarboxylase n=1 Tax=Serpentinicella alkaliphila TaxID=1734049 RepID=A0A4R2U272_9FIRM|nr:aminotransferase class I/II-fold pyridoxal phosphate-dependent enzyme [Serpentinicella alkaliphila]QUH25088.1 aminotransferase class I/II-fold pyridoxal phosphate-dependent enzyme [Serpentinicella alkaliphila]TCQ01733.1 arginine decarboxylase [Serpentinicella alkaliphila]